jgi:hypothetical protein
MWKILGILLVAQSAAFYAYYKVTEQKLTVLVENNVKLEIAIATSEEAIQSLQADYKRAGEELTRVNDEFREIRAQNNVLADKLARHDLGVLGASKPGLVQRTINNASAKALRCFELLSGAELTSKEKEATSAQEFNSECPWLYSTK